MDLKKYEIKPLDETAAQKAHIRLDSLVKPPGSLGKLEEIAEAVSAVTGEMFYDTKKRCVIIFASDNGVTEEGVAAAPQSVTYAQTVNFTRGITGVSVIAKQFNTDLIVVDVGVNAEINHPAVINKKIRKSASNIAKGAAMSRAEAEQAVLTGIETAVKAARDGYKLIGAGEMGIGNTTTAAAVLCALTGLPAEEAAGKGAGLTDEGYKNKIDVIKKAVRINNPNPDDPIDVVSKVGGFDIAAMAGAFIGAAHMRVPVVIDGFISITAALLAVRINPLVKNYMFASHSSVEPGYRLAAEQIGIEPCLFLNMRLGEGSGCPLMFTVIDAACAVIRDMGTFEEANIGDEYMEEIRDADFHIRRL